MRASSSLSFVSVVLLTLLSVSCPRQTRADEPEVKMGSWKVLYKAQPRKTQIDTNLEKYPLEVIADMELFGEFPEDPFRFNHVIVDGTWKITRGVLEQSGGRNAALKLGSAEDFELEMGLSAEGTGGWYVLFGFNEGKGHALYNVTLRTSGSPWFVTRFVRNEAVEGSDLEISRYECRGNEPFRMRVVDGKLTAQVNRRTLVEDHELEDYQKGDVIIGTYDTKYGPKPLKLYGIRVRTPKE